MTIKDKILSDLSEIRDQKLLHHIWEYIHLLRKQFSETRGNIQDILDYAGTLADEDAEEIKKDVDEQFKEIEGDW